MDAFSYIYLGIGFLVSIVFTCLMAMERNELTSVKSGDEAFLGMIFVATLFIWPLFAVWGVFFLIGKTFHFISNRLA